MQFSEFKKAVDWINSQKAFRKEVKLMGGEVTLNPDFPRMLSYLKEKSIIAVVLTNFNFNKEKIALFDKTIIKKYLEHTKNQLSLMKT